MMLNPQKAKFAQSRGYCSVLTLNILLKHGSTSLDLVHSCVVVLEIRIVSHFSKQNNVQFRVQQAREWLKVTAWFQ